MKTPVLRIFFAACVAFLASSCKTHNPNSSISDTISGSIAGTDESVKSFVEDELEVLDAHLQRQHDDAVRKQDLYDKGLPGGEDMHFDTENYWEGLPELSSAEQSLYERYFYAPSQAVNTHQISGPLTGNDYLQYYLDVEALSTQISFNYRILEDEAKSRLFYDRLKLEEDHFERRMKQVAADLKNSRAKGGLTAGIERLLKQYSDAYYRRRAYRIDEYDRMMARLVLQEGMEYFKALAHINDIRRNRDTYNGSLANDF